VNIGPTRDLLARCGRTAADGGLCCDMAAAWGGMSGTPPEGAVCCGRDHEDQTMATKLQESNAKLIFEPDDTGQLLRGWLLHAHKGRDRHDLAARKCNTYRLWVGGFAAALSAAVGTSVFAALEKADIGSIWKFIVGAAAILAAILTSLTTFLGYSERAEKHRSAGVRYKIAIRELERVVSAPHGSLLNTDPVVVGIEKQLDDLEESAPVVPERLYDQVEDRWKQKGTEFVGKASDLYQLKH
jgi:hypothetical protein